MAPLEPFASSFHLPTNLTNLSSHRHRPPSLSTRDEGWTEVWGAKDCHDSSDETAPETSRYVTVIPDGCDYIGAGVASAAFDDRDEDAASIKLTQHRPAWLEQIVLRMCRIPHLVHNSAYAAQESTGSLPNLLDLRCGQSSSADNASTLDDGEGSWSKMLALRRLNEPVFIGRSHPGGLGSYFHHQSNELNHSSQSTFLPSGSHIVDYLRLHPNTPDSILFHHADMQAYTALVQEKLDYILLCLRYGNDPAWEEVYKLQCAQACLDPNGERLALDRGEGGQRAKRKRRGFFSLWTWYQTHSERRLALQNLLPSSFSMHPSTHGMSSLELFRYNDYRCRKDQNESSDDNIHQHHTLSSYFPSYGGVGGGDSGRVNVHRAMEYADSYYSALEEKLASLPMDAPPYFFGTEKPSYLDALLFAHLAEAMCDLHLILVLAKHSLLLRYFQRMYDSYFGKDYIQSFVGNTEWIRKNNFANACNAYNQIPVAPAEKTFGAEDVGEMSHAIDLMQRLAVHCHQFDEALKDATNARLDSGEKEVLSSYHRPVASNLYRYCLGGGFWGSSQDDVDSHYKEGETEEGNEDANKDDVHRKWKAQMEHMKRIERTRDETWVMGVVVAVLGTVLVSACSRPK